MYFARTAQKLREQMFKFSGELSAGLPKVARRFVAEIVFGIQARGSVRLTEVGRALGERISLKKTEERLSRQLGRRGLEREIQRRLIEQAAPRIEGKSHRYLMADSIPEEERNSRNSRISLLCT